LLQVKPLLGAKINNFTVLPYWIMNLSFNINSFGATLFQFFSYFSLDEFGQSLADTNINSRTNQSNTLISDNEKN